MPVRLIGVLRPEPGTLPPHVSSPEGLVEFCARVSNPVNQQRDDLPLGRLLRSLVRRRHWSPLQMGYALLEVDTTRAIAHQVLRHRSFDFQEFSTRYQTMLAWVRGRRARRQDPLDRQKSIDDLNEETVSWWESTKDRVIALAEAFYSEALERGIAKEMARDILPEGLTASRLYMGGTPRSWVHYLVVRLDPSTQLEHRLLAREMLEALLPHYPTIMAMVEEMLPAEVDYTDLDAPDRYLPKGT